MIFSKPLILTVLTFSLSACTMQYSTEKSDKQTLKINGTDVTICFTERATTDVIGYTDFSTFKSMTLSAFKTYAESNNMNFAESPSDIPDSLGVTHIERACKNELPKNSVGYSMSPNGRGLNPYITYDLWAVEGVVIQIDGLYRSNESARKWEEENRP